MPVATTKSQKSANVLLAQLVKEGRALRADSQENERRLWAKRVAAALMGKPLPVKL